MTYMITDLSIRNYGSFKFKRGGRIVKLSPSPGGSFYYLTVYIDDKLADYKKVWPTEREKAFAMYIGSKMGFKTVICKTTDGERHTDIGGTDERFLPNL